MQGQKKTPFNSIVPSLRLGGDYHGVVHHSSINRSTKGLRVPPGLAHTVVAHKLLHTSPRLGTIKCLVNIIKHFGRTQCFGCNYRHACVCLLLSLLQTAAKRRSLVAFLCPAISSHQLRLRTMSTANMLSRQQYSLIGDKMMNTHNQFRAHDTAFYHLLFELQK